jgi:6-pyruvoyltetrahydropterin/6-carboxytetrahydropterin synthase
MENLNTPDASNISAVRKIHFCYGHRVMGHENKCGSLHGHNGILWIHARPLKSLDSIGRVVDFSVIKNVIGAWVDEHWDHTMIIFREDKTTIELLNLAPSFKSIFILNQNPTAENMAQFLLKEICPVLLADKNILVHKIVFYETENCFVEASL